jgi:predicted ATPase
LLRQDKGPGVVVSAVFGLGGIGKTTLAAAVLQKPQVLSRFPDGVIWVTLGQNPELVSLLGGWIRDLGDHEFRAPDTNSASGRLRQMLAERAVLLVVDDAWQTEHAEHFRVGGPRCRMLGYAR